MRAWTRPIPRADAAGRTSAGNQPHTMISRSWRHFVMMARWDPFAEMVSLRDAMNRLVNESVVRPTAALGTVGASGSLPFDLYESGDDVFVRLALPGIDPNSIELSVTRGVLNLKGYRTFYTGDQEKQFTW